MRTIVYQSYRTTNVPIWIQFCMQTVRSWAAENSFDYRFIDDQLFDYVPSWFLDKAKQQICPVADLARLVIAKQLLAQGYDRTVWMDADMVVFAPERLRVNIVNDFAFCHEVWLYENENGETLCNHRVNNSVAIFTKHNTQLDFFIDSCQRIARQLPQLEKLDIGTSFLTELYSVQPFPVLTNVGMFSPAVMIDIATGKERSLRTYAQNLITPLACANLCASLLGTQFTDVVADDRFYQFVVDKCLQTRGDVVNRFFPRWT